VRGQRGHHGEPAVEVRSGPAARRQADRGDHGYFTPGQRQLLPQDVEQRIEREQQEDRAAEDGDRQVIADELRLADDPVVEIRADRDQGPEEKPDGDCAERHPIRRAVRPPAAPDVPVIEAGATGLGAS
jgi:hypothetical protein